MRRPSHLLDFLNELHNARRKTHDVYDCTDTKTYGGSRERSLVNKRIRPKEEPYATIETEEDDSSIKKECRDLVQKQASASASENPNTRKFAKACGGKLYGMDEIIKLAKSSHSIGISKRSGEDDFKDVLKIIVQSQTLEELARGINRGEYKLNFREMAKRVGGESAYHVAKKQRGGLVVDLDGECFMTSGSSGGRAIQLGKIDKTLVSPSTSSDKIFRGDTENPIAWEPEEEEESDDALSVSQSSSSLEEEELTMEETKEHEEGSVKGKEPVEESEDVVEEETCTACKKVICAGTYMITSPLDGKQRCGPLYQKTPSCAYEHMSEQATKAVDAWNDMLPVIGMASRLQKDRIDTIKRKTESSEHLVNDLKREIMSKENLIRRQKYQLARLNEEKGDIDDLRGKLSSMTIELRAAQTRERRASHSLVEERKRYSVLNNEFADMTGKYSTKYKECMEKEGRIIELNASLEEMMVSNSTLESSMGRGLCCVCMTDASEVLFESCGHVCVCSTCSLKLGEGEDASIRCPSCRKAGTRKKVFIV